HPGIVLQVVQVHVALQDLVHRRSDALELLLDLIEDAFRMHLDVAFGVKPDAGDEYQIAVGDRSVEERRLLRLAAVSVVDFLDRLLTLCGGCRWKRRSGHGRCRGRTASDETASIRVLHLETSSQKINFAPRWICRMFGSDAFVALIRPT